MDLYRKQKRSSYVVTVLSALLTCYVWLILVLQLHWLIWPPSDPGFSWPALHSIRDLGYFEIDVPEDLWWVEGEEWMYVRAPNGSIARLPFGSLSVEEGYKMKLRIRLACRWEARSDLLGRYEGGFHSDCRILDLIFLEGEGQ